jgi:hypothetical protein
MKLHSVSGSIVLGLGLVFAGGSEASAQSWAAGLKAASSSCPQVPVAYAFTMTGSELAVKVPTGETHRGAVGADGKVTIQYKSTAQTGGTITISGNARTRELQLVNSGFTSCPYSMIVAVDPAASAYQGAVGDWAIGRWRGNRSFAHAGQGLRNAKQSLLVQKRPDGKVVCIWIDTEYEQGGLASPQCAITADAITLTSALGTAVELKLVKSSGGVEGLARDMYGSAQVSLSKQ